jgi:hypothetical protein
MTGRIARRDDRHEESGVALLIALMAMSVFSVLAMALALTASVDRLAASNHERAIELGNFTESALELAVRDLTAVPDWNAALTGAIRSPASDGPVGGVRVPWPGVAVDVELLTNALTCGQSSACSDSALQAATADRPWGPNNARWQPFLHTLIQEDGPPRPTAAYVIVWLGDDGREVDDDPLTDGGGPAGEGRYMIRAHAEAFGPDGGRHAIEAELARSCSVVDGIESCAPGIRVHSWRVVKGALP